MAKRLTRVPFLLEFLVYQQREERREGRESYASSCVALVLCRGYRHW